MKSAIVFLSKYDQDTLALQKVLGKCLIEYTIDRLEKAGAEKIYLVGVKEEIKSLLKDRVIYVDHKEEVLDELTRHEGRCILTGMNYPDMDVEVFETLYQKEAGVAVALNHEMIDLFALDQRYLKEYASLKYELLDVNVEDVIGVHRLQDIEIVTKQLQKKINASLAKQGVIFMDREHTYIGEDVEVEAGAYLYPDVYLEGKSKVGKDTTITAGSHLINAKIGRGCNILASRITDSEVLDHVSVGPYSHLRLHTKVEEDVRIGNFVEFKNTIFGKGSKCAHLTYLGDSEVGEDVNIGCGVITANYDGAHKFKTTIKDKCFIGSNSNLIAPVTIGTCALVAAGSTITHDVEDGAMAIARVRQEIKPGFGFKYINKEK